MQDMNLGLGGPLPIGLGMLLAGDQMALDGFNRLTDEERDGVIHYVQSGVDGDDAKFRVDRTIQGLRDGDRSFYRQ